MTFTNNLKGYGLKYKTSYLKELKRLPSRDAQAITQKLYALISGDTNLDIKKLQGKDNEYRLRHGIYRIIYEVHQHEIIVYVIKVGTRQSVYD